MDLADVHVETVIAGQRSDDKHLHDILSVIQSLGLRAWCLSSTWGPDWPRGDRNARDPALHGAEERPW